MLNSEKAGSDREVTLTRNKKVTYFPEKEIMLTGLVEQPLGIQPDQMEKRNEQTFNYQNRLLSEIIPQLEKVYGLTILLGNKKSE